MNENLPSMLPDSMPWSMNNPLSEIGHLHSILPASEIYDPHCSTDDDEDLYSEGVSESPLEKLRSILKLTQGNISQCEEIIKQIASIDEDLKEKCETIAVINLLPQNVSLVVAGNFQVISMGVDILIKYGINLLKPKRNPKWRSIKLANAVFRKKVQPLKGYEDVLREFGYTEQNEFSFDFLTYLKKPDVDKVAVVTADLLILQRELLQFINQTHVNKERFSKCFTYQITDLPVVLSSVTRDGLTPGGTPKQQNYQPMKVPPEDCVMCEGKPGIIHCDKCQSARCEACDRQWHSYPKKKSHQRTLLVEVVEQADVEEEKMKEETPEECFICGLRATFNCVTCPNFFCSGCEEIFHLQLGRQSHGRIKIGVSKKILQDASLPDPLLTGAKPKISSPVEAKPKMKDGLQKGTSEKSQEEHERKVRNLSYRLRVFYKEAQGDGYTLEDVKTACDIMEHESEPSMSLQELQDVAFDINLEFSQKYNVVVVTDTDQIPDIVSQGEIHQAWLRNGCNRKKTAAECVELLYEKVEELHAAYNNFDKIYVVHALIQNGFNVHQARQSLDKQHCQTDARKGHEWTQTIWNEDTSTYVAKVIEDIEKSQLEERKKKEQICNILMAGSGMSRAAVDTVFALRRQYELSDCIEAAKAAEGNLQRAWDYFKECDTCFTDFGMHKLVTLPLCQCHVCTECFTDHFTLLARNTPCMYKFTCPACNNPDLEHCDPETYQMYFAYLGTMLKNNLEKKDYELYEVNLATWGLIEDPNFRWCAHGCIAGFINERAGPKIQCPECKRHQCFACKKQWLDQHDGISCEEFDTWKKANDPEFQQQGLAAHLKENGINCPKCKMRYELAKGGCMHFKCPQCHHEFCCGCNLPFHSHPACNLLPSCKGKGLHAHHPRDCFYYLRDEDCQALQQLLQKHGIDYNQPTNAGAAAGNGEGPQVCPVKEQQETPGGLVDALCGKALKDWCGLCENHYKEYLVGLINQHNVDPVDIFDVDSLQATLRRNDKRIPNRVPNEADAAYCARLRQEVRQQLPLRPVIAQGAQGVSAAPFWQR